MRRRKQNQIIVLATLHRLAIMGQGAKHHLDRDALQRFPQGLGDLLADRQPYSIENQGGVDLQLDRIDGACPHVG